MAQPLSSLFIFHIEKDVEITYVQGVDDFITSHCITTSTL